MLELLLPSVSTYSKDIDRLFDLITYLVGFWTVLVMGFFFYCVFRFRRRDGAHARYLTGETHKEKLAIEVPHYLILLCDVAILVLTFIVWHKVKIDLPEADEEVRIVAQQWAWSFYHPGEDGDLGTEDDIALVNELHIKKDTQYTFYLESADVLHSFSVPVFRLKQDAVPGRRITGHFQATRTGEWDIQCAEMCGIAHGLMGARLIVHDDSSYEAWLASHAPAPPGEGELVAASRGSPASEKEDKDNG